MIVTSITIVAGKATITASARFPLATCVHERTTLSSTAKRTRLCHPLDKLVTLLYLRRIFFLRRGGCGCSRNKRKPIIQQGGWWITKNEMKETGRILFFFYLVDTKNVRISRKKSETIRQEIFKERIKDMIFEKKNKENSREIAHLARYTKDIWTIIVESIVIDDFREIKQLEKEHPFHFRRKITRSKRRRRIRKSKLWKIIHVSTSCANWSWKNSIDPLLFQSLIRIEQIIDIEIEICPKDETAASISTGDPR